MIKSLLECFSNFLQELGPALVVGVVVAVVVVALLGISNFKRQPNALGETEEHLKSEGESQRNKQANVDLLLLPRRGSPTIRKGVSRVAGCRRRNVVRRKPFLV